MSVELRLPNITAETNEGKIEQLQSFIYQLVQELNWYLNLEKASTSSTEDLDTKKLINRVEDAEGNYSSIVQSVDMIETKVSNVQGDVSTLQQTASSLSTRVTNAEGNASYAVQTANGLSSTVSKKVGNDEIISKINQSAESVSISAGKINFNGATTVNKRFYIDTNGYLHLNSTNATIELIDNGSYPSSSTGLKVNISGDTMVYGAYGINVNNNGSSGHILYCYGGMNEVGNLNLQTRITSKGRPKVYWVDDNDVNHYEEIAFKSDLS